MLTFSARECVSMQAMFHVPVACWLHVAFVHLSIHIYVAACHTCAGWHLCKPEMFVCSGYLSSMCTAHRSAMQVMQWLELESAVQVQLGRYLPGRWVDSAGRNGQKVPGVMQVVNVCPQWPVA